MTLQKQFIENVTRLLEESRTTRSALSREMEVSPGYVTEYLNGRVSPGLDVIARFAVALKVDPVELLMSPAQLSAIHAETV